MSRIHNFYAKPQSKMPNTTQFETKRIYFTEKKYCVLCLAFNAYNGLMSMFSNKATERKLHSVRQLDATSFDKLDYRRKA